MRKVACMKRMPLLSLLFLFVSGGFALIAYFSNDSFIALAAQEPQTLIDKREWPQRSFSGSLFSDEMEKFNTPLPLEGGRIIVELHKNYSRITLYNTPKPLEYKKPLFPEITGSCEFSLVPPKKELVCVMDFDSPDFNLPIILRFVPDEAGRLKMYSLDDTFLTLWSDALNSTQ